MGSVGPLDLGLVLDKIPLFNGLIKTDDSDKPYTWDCGDSYGSPSGIVATLGILGFTCLDQTLAITARNPLYKDDIALQGVIKANRYGEDAWSYEKSLDGEVLASSGSNGGVTRLASVDVPGTGCISGFQIYDLRMELPGDPFKLLKTGVMESNQMGRLRGQLDLYLELAYGYSRRVGDKLSLGGRLKLLAGLYGVDYNVTRLNLTMYDL